MENNTINDTFQDWKTIYNYLDQNWGSELIKQNLPNIQIIQMVEKGNRYLKYRSMVRELKLNNIGTVHLKLVEFIINHWEEIKTKPEKEIIQEGLYQ